MPDNPNRLSQFWQELKRRKVVRVITVYAAAAFVILELVSIIVDPLRLPEWTLPMIIVLLCIGFIIAIILSWIYDIHPNGGIVKTEPVHKKEARGVPAVSNNWKIASYISFVIIVVLIVLHMVPLSNRTTEGYILDKSIAVLPFINDSPEKENEYFINGTMEAILDHLCKIEDLKVVGRTSAEHYRNTSKPIPTIAEELNVSFILEGSGQKYGNNIRITLQLLDARNDKHLWSSPYTREVEIDDIFNLQSEIAQRVAKEIEVIITPEVKQRIEKIPTESLEAYNAFLLGKHFYSQHTPENFKNGITHFNRAIQLDSTFALAYIYLAHTYQLMVRYSWIKSDSIYKEVKEAILKSIELDNTLGEAHAAWGLFKIVFDWDLYGPDEDFRKAIELSPNSAEIHSHYAQYLRWMGRFEEGKVIARHALELDPATPNTTFWLGAMYFYAEQYDEAIRHLKGSLTLDSNYIQSYAHLAYAYALKGEYEKAIYYADKTMTYETWSGTVAAGVIGWVYAKAGDSKRAHEILERIREMPSSASYQAFVYHGLGDSEKAIDLLYQAYAERSGTMIYLNAFSYTFLKEMKDNPRFISLLRKIGFHS